MVRSLGISTFADDPESVAQYLVPLLEHARTKVPPSLQPETPLFLLATAGMRLLTPVQQAEILVHTCKFLKHHSNFRIDDRSHMGPCGSSVRIITGEEEGLFGWIAVNYLMDGFSGSSDVRTTYGFLDMGGASTQIAFEPSEAERKKTPNLINVRLRRIGGEEIQHEVFVTTWLGYGTNQARQRYVGRAIDEFRNGRESSPSDPGDVIHDPCLPKNLKLVEYPLHSDHLNPHHGHAHTLVGTGSFEQCLERTSTLLNKDAPCPDSPCLFNGVHVPPIDFSVSHFIGVSEYWYSSEHVFGLGGSYDFVQYERAAATFCARDWDSLVEEHKQASQHHRLGGDGEVEEAGRVVKTGKWGPQIEISRLGMQCFKAAWVTNVLHEGIGLPRIVDPGGNISTDGDNVADQAARKGLGRPVFQSLDSVGDIAISWTLGKMVLEASKEVPLASKTDRPLHDPLDDIPDYVDSPIRPIRPPFINIEAIEDRISYHLPSLSKSSLGFSPVIFLLYVFSFCLVLFLGRRLRRSLRAVCRKSIRDGFRRDHLTQRDYSMEEGNAVIGGLSGLLSSPPRWLYPLRKLFPPSRPRLTPLNTLSRPLHGAAAHPRNSPTRTHSLPTIPSEDAIAHSTTTSTRPSSPSPGGIRPPGDDVLSRSTNSPMRSRNSSQMNLTTAFSRQPNGLSRSNSMLHPPGSNPLQED